MIAAIEPAAQHEEEDVEGDDEAGVDGRVVVDVGSPVGGPYMLDADEATKGDGEVGQREGDMLGDTFEPCNAGACPDGEVDEEVEEGGIAAGEVVLDKDGHGIVEGVDIVHAAMLGAFALVMDDAAGGEVVVLEPRQLDAPREVDVLAVHEIRLVEQPHFLQCHAANHQEGTGEDVDGVGCVVVEVSHIVGGDAAVVWEEADEAADFEERGRRGGKSAFALLQVLAFAVNHLHGKAATVGMGIVEGDTLAEGVELHHGVGVEQEDEVAAALAQSLVVGFGKP